MTQEEMEKEIAALKERNARVETDKAWERSAVRIYSIAFITYVAAAALLTAIGNDHVWRNALVPVAGYLLSTQSLPSLKTLWKERRQRRFHR